MHFPKLLRKSASNQLLLWGGALLVGSLLGCLNQPWLNSSFDFVASVFTRLFQFVAVPTIALAVITTLSSLGEQHKMGRVFLHTLTFTLLTTVCAAGVGLGLFLWVCPANLPTDVVASLAQSADALPDVAKASYYDHILSVIPNNILYPFLSANVLSILIVASAMGLTIAYLRRKADAEHQVNEPVETVLKVIVGLQELLFAMIRALVKVLPVGIVAFAGQLVAQVEGGIIVGSLGTYTLVILAANLLQFFVVLPLFLLVRGLNPWRVLRAMTPAVLMALFTKSSAATLPVTIRSAEERLGVNRSVSRFVLPICCTVNMNGCATFILVTSLYVMQNGGTELSIGSMILWLLISVISAVGNAGVPMGCYFLTLSLMAGIQSPALGIMGIILPIFTVIDMIETAENVWSDSCVCAIVDKQTKNSK